MLAYLEHEFGGGPELHRQLLIGTKLGRLKGECKVPQFTGLRRYRTNSCRNYEVSTDYEISYVNTTFEKTIQTAVTLNQGCYL